MVWTENFLTQLNREIRRAPSGDFEFGAGSDLINDGKMTPEIYYKSVFVYGICKINFQAKIFKTNF